MHNKRIKCAFTTKDGERITFSIDQSIWESLKIICRQKNINKKELLQKITEKSSSNLEISINIFVLAYSFYEYQSKIHDYPEGFHDPSDRNDISILDDNHVDLDKNSD